MLRIVSTQSSPAAALAAALAARGDLPRMRKALAALSDADLESAAMRCLCYIAAGVKRADAFRLDDAALRAERLRRSLEQLDDERLEDPLIRRRCFILIRRAAFAPRLHQPELGGTA